MLLYCQDNLFIFFSFFKLKQNKVISHSCSCSAFCTNIIQSLKNPCMSSLTNYVTAFAINIMSEIIRSLAITSRMLNHTAFFTTIAYSYMSTGNYGKIFVIMRYNSPIITVCTILIVRIIVYENIIQIMEFTIKNIVTNALFPMRILIICIIMRMYVIGMSFVINITCTEV